MHSYISSDLRDLTGILIIAGPTSSGKSGLAMGLADKYERQIAIINADASQIYKDIKILASCPSEADYQKLPHYLYEILDVTQVITVVDWCKQASQVIEQLMTKNILPVIVGGTGFYIKTLIEGIGPMPEVKEKILCDLEDELRNRGVESLYKKLQDLDPTIANRLKPRDKQRILRALAVCLSSGVAMSEIHKLPKKSFIPNIEKKIVKLLPEREKLYKACDERFLYAFNNGAVEEVKTLVNKYEFESIKARPLGLQEIYQYIQGKVSKEEAIKLAQQFIRNYAKRQLTLFRNVL